MDAEECLKDYAHLMKMFSKIEFYLNDAQKNLERGEFDSPEWKRAGEMMGKVHQMLDGTSEHENYNTSLETQLEEIEEDCGITLSHRVKETHPINIRSAIGNVSVGAARLNLEPIEEQVTDEIDDLFEGQ